MHLGELGAEPLRRILGFLKLEDIAAVGATCRQLREAALDQELWRSKANELHLVRSDGISSTV